MDDDTVEPAGLAPVHELALELEREGLTHEELAERLGIPPEAVPVLLRVAHAKAEADG